ncbi:subtilisin-like protease-like [Dorcoceras hygrometricum]|uniref:Subtilisin-like protease-like n=1 Tax=Dorcoceras hygrometricum TaxID=472368 RepID=A0A2Z7CYI2_9LAMI|nr:subtilisin-like protease-like [Dorcoceras hygrometricum]
MISGKYGFGVSQSPFNNRLHTTRSWDFINLLEANWDSTQVNGEEFLGRAGYGKDVVVGVLDSGVCPESASFSDEGMDPVPGMEFVRSGLALIRLIATGARYYLKGYEAYYGPLSQTADLQSPRDVYGHGTHTSSTIGGRRVTNAATIGGFGNGTASGGAPLVRLAIYKVCWLVPNKIPAEGNTCLDDDILAAFDDAIADGVQVISASLGKTRAVPYYEDGLAIGALHAAKRDIVVSCSAGNNGPDMSTVSNVAPWVITVGASSIDRVFISPVVLGDGIVLQGQSITPFQKGTYQLVFAGDVEIPGATTNTNTGFCGNGTLSPSLVKGKAVFCRSGDVFEALEVQGAGGIATVLGNIFDGIGVLDRPYLIPGTVILSNETDGLLTPFMAGFSSRGPNSIDPSILKPDITAPGLNILAAWSEAASPLNVPSDDRVVRFQIDSGTSMACPHVSAASALVKAIHPDWSSAAIRSALMTTAKITNNVGNQITDALGTSASPFDYGAGHIQPSKAADPGLVYDASYTDYLLFLCNNRSNIFDPSFTCPDDVPSPSNLNYPSVTITNLAAGSVSVTRSVTNVGLQKSSYSLTLNSPPGYTVEINPQALTFNSVGEKQNFTITAAAGTTAGDSTYAYGWYTWSDGIHLVTSPIMLSLT